jgi:hypothetical protein
MLEWTEAGPRVRLTVLVHHDDLTRESAYGEDFKVGTFSAELRDEAVRHGWVVISMNDEGKQFFPFEKSARSPQIRDQRGQRRRVRGRPIRSLRQTDLSCRCSWDRIAPSPIFFSTASAANGAKKEWTQLDVPDRSDLRCRSTRNAYRRFSWRP